MGRPRKHPLATPADAAQVELAVESPQAVEAAPVVEAALAAVVVEKPRAGLYRVTRGIWFNQHGASQWLAVGTLIDESVVGAAHIAELKRHRIPLEEV
jgi:hypothetical protein